MSIQHDNLPFDVYFDFYNEQKHLKFYDSMENARVDINIEIEEYQNFTINFVSKNASTIKSAKLYFSQLEILRFHDSNDSINIDNDGNYYINIDSKPVRISFTDDILQLNPGLHDLKVEVDGNLYYSTFNITSKNLPQSSVELMIKELNEIIKGIGFEIICKGNIGDSQVKNVVNSGYLKKYFVLKENMSTVLTCLEEISTKPLQNIIKEYEVRPYNSVRNIDYKSSRWLQSHKGQQKASYIGGRAFTKILSPLKVINYDLDENRYTKYIVNSFIKTLSEIKQECTKYLHERMQAEIKFNNKEEQYKKYFMQKIENIIFDISSMIYKLVNIIQHPFWINIEPLKLNNNYSVAIVKDSKYKILYDIYKKLNIDYDIELDRKYSFIYKRNSLLYEYWCYFYIVKILVEKMGFEVEEKGWNNQLISQNKFIPFLKEGGCLKLTNCKIKQEDISIYLWFNKAIQKELSKAKRYNDNVYIKQRINKDNKTHNKPDIRMDIYIDEVYEETIIFDAKYRPLKNIIYGDCSEQLEDYGQRTWKTRNNGREAISMAVALYSNNEGDSSIVNRGTLSNVDFYNLIPGESNNEFNDFLIKEVYSIIKYEN